jgi:hypothetical protein
LANLAAYALDRNNPSLKKPCCALQQNRLIDVRFGSRGARWSDNGINLRNDVDVCSDLHFFVQLDDVGVVHPETAMRDGAAD